MVTTKDTDQIYTNIEKEQTYIQRYIIGIIILISLIVDHHWHNKNNRITYCSEKIPQI